MNKRYQFGDEARSFLELLDHCDININTLYNDLYTKLLQDVHAENCDGPGVKVDINNYSPNELRLFRGLAAAVGLRNTEIKF